MDARSLIAEVLRTTGLITPSDMRLSDIDGWDSLKGVRLILRLEEIVGRELTDIDIETLNSIGDVDRLLATN